VESSETGGRSFLSASKPVTRLPSALSLYSLLAGPAEALRFRSSVLAAVLFTGLRQGSKPGGAKTPSQLAGGRLGS
jgi:hypothetical protein